jgi:hypothetical protein
MRAPKGFGKNYFTLAAIQATASQKNLNARQSSVNELLHVNYSDDEESLDDELISLESTLDKESDCSCLCSQKSQRIIQRFSNSLCFIPTYIKSFSVSSPPLNNHLSNIISIFKGHL